MTNISRKTDKQCDSCATKNIEIKKRYKNEAYCANCYRIWFIKKPCNKCGEISCLHKKEELGICSSCRISKPCIRCEGPAVKNGANTEYGRVCQICYQGYFKAKQECFECGEFKKGVSSYSKLPHNHVVCVSCYQRHFRDTCSLCHKYRELKNTEQGKICQKCHDIGQIPCESCNNLMPAGMGKRCDDCYWSQRLIHATKINTYLLSSEIMKQAYRKFTHWFSVNKGNKIATLKHSNFINFFVRCDEIWGKIPSYESLIQEFKPNGLRENLTVLRWLIKTKQVIVNTEIKEQIAEQERIINLLAKFDDNQPTCIKAYQAILFQKLSNRKTSLKSIRLALQPAVDLCIRYSIKDSNIPDQEHLDSYLLSKSGQYSSLYGFVTFLNKEYNLKLICQKPTENEVLKANRDELEKQIINFLNEHQSLSTNDELKWLQLGMLYFHGTQISLSSLKKISSKQVVQSNMTLLIYGGKEYWLPSFI